MKIKKLLEIVNGIPLNLENPESQIKNFIINSKESTKGSFFVPLKGNKTDGHLFIEDAVNRGSVGFFTEKYINLKNGILIKNSLEALEKVGKFKRKGLSKVIAITGTSGKTTTKELIAFGLESFFPVYSTKGNLNNEIGLPLTLANIPEGAKIGVFELGAGKIGDIEHLSALVNQEISVLTSVGHGHTEKFGSFENVLKGKGEIFNHGDYAVLPDNLLNQYKKYLKNYITFGKNGDIRVSDIKFSKDGTEGEISYKNEKIKIKVPVFSKAIIYNIAAVSGVFYFLDINPVKHLSIFENFIPPKGRGNIIKHKNITIIDDTYNANPLSVRNAIETLSSIDGFKVIVLGDMLELGSISEKLHREIGMLIEKSNIDMAFFFGKETKFSCEETKKGKFFNDKKELAKAVKNVFREQKGFLLIKGSRGMKMEEVLQYILQ